MDIKDILDKLSEEEKAALNEHQQKENIEAIAKAVAKAVAKAKKDNTQRNLDKQDRERASAMLKHAGCTVMPLSAVRTLALRWVLSDTDTGKQFGDYIKSLQDGKQVRKANKV